MASGLHVRFDDPAAFRQEYERNISNGGAFVPSSRAWELRSVVPVELELAWCGESVHLEAEIVHRTPEGTDPRNAGVAVQFLAPVAELRERLGPIAAAAGEVSRPEPEPRPALEAEPQPRPEPRTEPEFEIGSGPELDALADFPDDDFEDDGIEPPSLADSGLDQEPLDPELVDDDPLASVAADPPLEVDADVTPLPREFELELDEPARADETRTAIVEEDATPQPAQLLTGEERRRTDRETARVPVHLEAAHISLDGRTRDISEGGVLLSADGSDLPIGKRVRLNLTHPHTGERMELGGSVVRHVETAGTIAAVAIEFDERLEGDEHVMQFIAEVKAADNARREGGISGVIEELGMANLLQMFGQSSRQGTVTLSSGSEEGVVAFADGSLRYARLGALRGIKALARLIAWDSGAFEFVSQVDDLPDEDEPISLDGAILEAVRQIDEANRESGDEIDASDVLRLERNRLARLDTPLSQTEESVLDLAAAGLSVRRLLDVIPESDAAILGALRSLQDRGIVALTPADDS